MQTYSEEFVKIDDENRFKEAAVIEGDLLSLGFITYVTRFQITEKGPSSSVITSTVECEYHDGRPELEAAAACLETCPVCQGADDDCPGNRLKRKYSELRLARFPRTNKMDVCDSGTVKLSMLLPCLHVAKIYHLCVLSGTSV